MKMEEELHKRVVSQDEAIKSISKAVRRSRSGLKDPKRPTGCFIFAGPTGVGKTLLAKALAEFMFGDADALIQIDMSEYMEKHNVSRLIGAPPGYVGYEEGGQLTEKIRRRPYAVVLLDEIEKAHPDVYNMLLQIMEEGRLTDSFGRNVDFRNAILIMTTNAGAEAIKNESAFGFQKPDDDASYENMKGRVQEQIEKVFRPEFLGRMDDVIVFRHLTNEDLADVVEMELSKVRERLGERGLKLVLTPEAKKLLVKRGSNLDFGARPLRRAIENFIEDPLSEELLKGEFQGMDTITIEVKEVGDKKQFYFHGSVGEPPQRAAGRSGPAPARAKATPRRCRRTILCRRRHALLRGKELCRLNGMSTAEEIESAVSGLPPEELSRFRTWFEKFDADSWDRQWEEDAKAGRLDHLADKAIQDFRQGRCTEL